MATTNERYDALSDALTDNWWAIGLRGVFGIAFGLICILVPGVAILTLVLLFAAYMLVDGAFAIASGIRQARQGERWGLLILEGVVNIAAGVIAFLWPGITALVFVYLIAFWALLSGGLMVASAISLRLDHGRWWLGLAGVASVIFGVLLLIVPLIGAVVLTLWLGAYAIVFGLLLLMLAYKLHERRDERGSRAPATSRAASASSGSSGSRSTRTPRRSTRTTSTAKRS